MSAIDLIDRLSGRGIELVVDGDKQRWRLTQVIGGVNHLVTIASQDLEGW